MEKNCRQLEIGRFGMLLVGLTVLVVSFTGSAARGAVLDADAFKHYVEQFNAHDEELTVQHVPNAQAWAFLEDNIPLLECPDKDIEQTYYFRWWTFRKHIKETSDGFVITEFLPKVGWSGKHNTISCPAGHHLYEGRWLHDPRYLDDYSIFWFRKGGDPRRYSFWAADAMWARALVTGDDRLPQELLPDLIANYQAWEKHYRDDNGLFWQVDGRDGMEVSISGRLHPHAQGYRATINSYMYGDALAIARIAEKAGRKDIAERFRDKAATIRRLLQEKLWDPKAQFFMVLPRGEDTQLSDARELHGYTPWYFNIPDTDQSVAWKQLMDPKGFYAPFGPTTAEQRHPGFAVSYQGHECQWNGPSWPLATSVTLTALANVLNAYQQDVISAEDYFETLKIYTKSHRRRREDGRVVPWIDENLNPFTGDWLSRTRLKSWKNGTWDAGKGGKERGKDYNHSTYCDLVITGLIGLRPRVDDCVEVNPLVPEGAWDYFCLDRIRYHGRWLTILYDRTGQRYKRGRGLRVLADGKEIAASECLTRVTGKLPNDVSLGLYVQEGVLKKGGLPYQGVGANYFSLFSRLIADANDTSSLANLSVLARRDIPFVRFMAGGFWPVDWQLYQTDRQAYFERFDRVVRCAETHGVGLIPSLFWHLSTVSDIVGESLDQMGDPDSKTNAFMRQYTQEVVTRYRNSPAIWGWEFGNEYNLGVDLPNHAQHRPPVVPRLGTAKERTERDELTFDQLRVAFVEFARTVREHDKTRVIISGNAMPRPSAWHNVNENTWTRDTDAQFGAILLRDNPDPMDTISVHLYPNAKGVYPGGAAPVEEALSLAAQHAARAGKPLFLGEFGAPRKFGDAQEQEAAFRRFLEAIKRHRVPLAAFWVFDYDRQESEWNVSPSNDRAFLLDLVSRHNREVRIKP